MNMSERAMPNRSETVVFEPTPERLKVTLTEKVNRLVVGLFTLALLVWLAMLVTVAVLVAQGQSSGLVRTGLIVIWGLLWLWFGRFLWSRWQFYVANREILFIDEEQMVIRRPVSILGITTAYDFRHVSPFYYSDRHGCPAFDYAYLHVYFGRSLTEDEGRNLVGALNRRYFPHVLEDEAVEEF